MMRSGAPSGRVAAGLSPSVWGTPPYGHTVTLGLLGSCAATGEDTRVALSPGRHPLLLLRPVSSFTSGAHLCLAHSGGRDCLQTPSRLPLLCITETSPGPGFLWRFLFFFF